jgi:hypothetical protein
VTRPHRRKHMRKAAPLLVPAEVEALAANYRCADCRAPGKPRRGPDDADGTPTWQVAVRHIAPCPTVRRVVDSPAAGLAAAEATTAATGLEIVYTHRKRAPVELG